jgi:hypothetical protein
MKDQNSVVDGITDDFQFSSFGFSSPKFSWWICITLVTWRKWTYNVSYYTNNVYKASTQILYLQLFYDLIIYTNNFHVFISSSFFLFSQRDIIEAEV